MYLRLVVLPACVQRVENNIVCLRKCRRAVLPSTNDAMHGTFPRPPDGEWGCELPGVSRRPLLPVVLLVILVPVVLRWRVLVRRGQVVLWQFVRRQRRRLTSN